MRQHLSREIEGDLPSHASGECPSRRARVLRRQLGIADIAPSKKRRRQVPERNVIVQASAVEVGMPLVVGHVNHLAAGFAILSH